MSAMVDNVQGDYNELAASGESWIEGTTGRMMMIERLGRSNGAMANNEEVKNFHLNTKCNNK
jgi:hypothetical protein